MALQLVERAESCCLFCGKAREIMRALFAHQNLTTCSACVERAHRLVEFGADRLAASRSVGQTPRAESA